MFGYALRHPKLPASNGIVNKAGLTPLTLACKLGETRAKIEIFQFCFYFTLQIAFGTNETKRSI